jgi:hypothetical protein
MHEMFLIETKSLKYQAEVGKGSDILHDSDRLQLAEFIF